MKYTPEQLEALRAAVGDRLMILRAGEEEIAVQRVNAETYKELREIAGRFEHAGADVEEAPGVLVSAFLLVDDIDWLLGEFNRQATVFKNAGVRKVWVFQAFDDPREVMIVQELGSEEKARQWTHRHDAATEWMERTGVGVYPSLFVGEFLDLLRVGDVG